MATDELKEEIQKVLDAMPDEALEEILAVLKTIEEKSRAGLIDGYIEKIFSEDKELLKRLS